MECSCTLRSSTLAQNTPLVSCSTQQTARPSTCTCSTSLSFALQGFLLSLSLHFYLRILMRIWKYQTTVKNQIINQPSGLGIWVDEITDPRNGHSSRLEDLRQCEGRTRVMQSFPREGSVRFDRLCGERGQRDARRRKGKKHRTLQFESAQDTIISACSID